jgi:ATP-dependent helicase/nuclease subunit A
MAPEAPAPAAAHHDVKWTQEQRAGISTTGTGLLLSAAAGSGKTAVLAERCAHLVCDATPPCSVDELLVVTFTRAAAGEMRTRIEQALRKRLDQSDDPRLHQQIALLERAQISTLHSFCTTVLRRHFNVLGIDPGFRLLDEEEGKLLRLQTIRDVLGRHYESEKAGDFEHFIDTFGDGHDETLVKRLLHLHALLESLVDPHAWLDTALDRLREAAEKPLSRSELGGGFIRLLDERLAALLDECDTIDRLIAQYPGCMPYASTVSDIRALVDRLRGKLASGDIDGLASVLDDNPVSKLSSVKNDTPGQQRVKQAIDALREPLKKGDLLAWCRASGSQWIEGMKATLPAANMLADLVREFNQAYRQAKEELRALDYADLERLTLRVLRDPDQPSRLHPSRAAREYHQQIRHVLVDEYQDINELQSAILLSLIHI